jgi:hypothetical protein
MQSSFGTPGAGHGGQQSSQVHDSPVDINDDMKAAGMGNGVAAGMAAAAGVGLGIGLPPMNARSSEVILLLNICAYIYFMFFKKGPPSRLVLSHSSGALKESGAKTATAIPVNGEDEDHGHLSDVCLKPHSLYYLH